MSNDLVQQKSSYFVRKTPASSSTSTTNVQNKPAPVLNIPGTRTSIQNSQLLTSIGIPSIDSFIGGGLPVGGICLVGQDKLNTYTDVLSRCFIAEGIFHKHSIYVADLNEDKNSLFQRIPDVGNKLELQEQSKPNPTDQLRIAWRYAQEDNQSTHKSSTYQANYFVTNKFMSKDDIFSSVNIKSFDPAGNNKSLYTNLANDLTKHIDDINMNINKTKQYTNIVRIVINSAGGLCWNDKSTLNEIESVNLCRFLIYLRGLLRHSLAICLITVPNEVTINRDLFEKFSHLCDYSFSFDDTNSSVSGLANTQYDGLFRLTKLPRLNTLNSCFQPETLDLAFYLKKKRLVVEQLHLPPDLGENDDTQKGRTNTSVTMSCSTSGSSKPSKLDF